MKRILFFMVLVSLSTIINAQSLYELQGKSIVIPGRNPSELIYTRTALEKKSFKDEYKSHAVISNKEIHISKVAEHFKGRKKSLIIEFECGTDSLLLRFPLVMNEEEVYRIYTDDRYYSNCYDSKNWEYNFWGKRKYEFNDQTFNIPYFYAQDIKTIKEEILNKSFFSRLFITQTSGKKIIVEKSDVCKVLTFTDYYFDEDDILCLNYKQDRINTTGCLGLLNPHIAGSSKNEIKDNTLDFVKECLVPCKPLFEAAKSSDAYLNLKSLVSNYKGKEIHINYLSLKSSFCEGYTNKSQFDLRYIEEGIYSFKDFKLIAYSSNGKGVYLPYIILQEKNSDCFYYLNLDVNTFEKNIMLKEEYEEQVRLKELKEQKELEEAERKRQAYLKAKHNKLVKKYGKSNATLIENGQIKLGFTEQMVIEAWGQPDNISTVTNTMFVIESWSYDWDFVTFKNGRVVQIIN